MKLLSPLLGVCQSVCWVGGGMMSMDFAKPQNPLSLFNKWHTFKKGKKVTFKKLKQVDKCFFKWS